MKSLSFSIAVAICLAVCAGQANAIPFAISGPGTTSVVNDGLMSTGTYDNPGLFSATQVWDMTAIATGSEKLTFEYDYTGFHSFFRVTAFLQAVDGGITILESGGPDNCCGGVSNGFSFQGTHTFTGLTAGDVIGFRFGGNHFDGSQQMRGTLKLMQIIPEPATATLGLIGLAGLMVRRRRAA